MYLLYTTLIILLIGILVYLYFFRKKSEPFQNQEVEDNTPPILINQTVSENSINAAIQNLQENGFSIDSSGIPVNPYVRFTPDNMCAQYTAQLESYNLELQRHRDEGNWNHVEATRSYIDIVRKRQIASDCPTN
jgi:hypothetical protein